MPRTIGQALGFLLGFWIALWLSPLVVQVARAEAASGPIHEELEAALLDGVNRERARHHLIPLRRNAALDRVARAHAADMARRGYAAHVNPEGANPMQRIAAGGVSGFTLAAENIGRTNLPDPNREIIEAWLASSLHRRNLLLPVFNTTGIGIARAPDGNWLYTQLYVTYPR